MSQNEQGTIAADIVSAADYERHAAARLDKGARAYLDGAAADGLTDTANCHAWRDLRLKPRVLGDMRGANTGLTLLGQTLPHPLLVAPVAYHGLFHPQAECATRAGAAAAGAPMVVSSQAGMPLEQIAAAGEGPLWFQLYMQPRREDTLSLLRRAEAAGCQALVLTVDAPVNGIRNHEQRAGFRLPAGLSAVNLQGFAQPQAPEQPGRGPTFLGLLDAAPRWQDVEWLRAQTRLPLLLKGIVAAPDARRALDCGADGIIVSNHGGRTLDTLPATAEILPVIAAAIGGRVPVLCDGGIRRGTDVLKALALGADAVLIGRPVIHALAVAGALGVAHLLSLLRHELEVAMALTGRATLVDIDPDVIWNYPG